MEEYDISVSSTNCNFIMSYRDDTLDPLSTDVLSKDKELIFDLEAAEVSTRGSSEEVLLVWEGEAHAGVVSHEGSSRNELVGALASCRLQAPEEKFLSAGSSKLILLSRPQLDVLDIASPLETRHLSGVDLA
jgi:hypothetical protein